MRATDFNTALLALQRTKPVITVAHCADCHFPDHSPEALELTYAIYKRSKPDVIVVGSDEADFSVLSSFDPDPDAAEQTIDVLDDFSAFHRTHVERLRKAVPKALIVFIHGNHERRIFNFLAIHAPYMRRYVGRGWIDIVRAGGLCHWVGNVSEILITDHLLVKHGERSSEHVSKAMLVDAGYQVSIMAGHTHRLNQFTFKGYHRTVTAVTSGCLCKTVPGYMSSKGVKPLRQWQQGSAIARIDVASGNVWIENLLYLRDENGVLQTVLEGAVITA